VKQSFRLSGVSPSALALALFLGAVIASAQTPSATPDSFFAQITNVPTNTRNAFANGISGNGRFVVIESTANLAPIDPARPDTVEPNNADGNREIFLFDYVQRRIFQITNTRHALKDTTKPPVDPATPTNFSNIDVEVSNNRPVVSFDGRWIAFSSNAYVDGSDALSPKNFNGSDNRAALKADGNQEIFLYRIPDVPNIDLADGSEVSSVNLADGTLTRITFTTNTAKPQPGTATVSPSAVDDNRFAALNDDGSFVAFVSSRNLPAVNGGSNADLNPEIYIYNRITGTFSQVTATTNPTNSSVSQVWSANPSFSASGTRLSFISSADTQLAGGAAEADNAKGNGEVYFADFNGAAVSNVTRVTRTPIDSRGSSVVLSPGARLSRDGNLILFESTADIQSSGTVNGDIRDTSAIYLYTIAGGAFTQITQRPAADAPDLSLRFPAFTGDGSTIVFASLLNFRTDGQIAASTTEGLNPNRRVQIFAVPVSAPTAFTRLTNSPSASLSGLQPFPSNTTRRLAFSFSSGEFGGGNADNSSEVFYLFTPNVTGEAPSPSPGPVSYATGASDRPVATASPTPTTDSVSGLAAGMLAIARSTTVTFAPSNREVDKNNAQEDRRRLPLPIELSGVSVGIRNAAAGLYFVSPGQINFVVPTGLAPGAYPVVINNNGTVIRSTLQVIATQPDIFTSTNGPGGRAAVLNVTNPLAPTAEPFSVTTTRPKADGSGTETVATELLMMVTGVRGVARTAVTVRIGSTDLTGDAIISVNPSLTAGFDEIRVRLPASLAGAGDVPVIVTVSGGAASRPAESAPRIRIN